MVSGLKTTTGLAFELNIFNAQLQGNITPENVLLHARAHIERNAFQDLRIIIGHAKRNSIELGKAILGKSQL